jgi:hypothetical protein
MGGFVMRTATLLIFSLAATPVALAQDQPTTPPPAAAPAIAGPAAPQVESIKIFFDDKAKTDGELRFEFTPVGGTAKTIRVTIMKKMDKNEVAQDAAKELSVALGPEYKVDRYDADKVKVESKKDMKFSLTIAALTANGLSVRLK